MILLQKTEVLKNLSRYDSKRKVKSNQKIIKNEIRKNC